MKCVEPGNAERMTAVYQPFAKLRVIAVSRMALNESESANRHIR